VYETEELAREEVERVGSNQSIPVLELRGVRDRGTGQGGGGAREEVERVGSNQSIPVLELRGV
jgi:hypothetical protein